MEELKEELPKLKAENSELQARIADLEASAAPTAEAALASKIVDDLESENKELQDKTNALQKQLREAAVSKDRVSAPLLTP